MQPDEFYLAPDTLKVMPPPVPVVTAYPPSCSSGRTFTRVTRTGVGHAVWFFGVGLPLRGGDQVWWRYRKAEHEASGYGYHLAGRLQVGFSPS